MSKVTFESWFQFVGQLYEAHQKTIKDIEVLKYRVKKLEEAPRKSKTLVERCDDVLKSLQEPPQKC